MASIDYLNFNYRNRGQLPAVAAFEPDTPVLWYQLQGNRKKKLAPISAVVVRPKLSVVVIKWQDKAGAWHWSEVSPERLQKVGE